MTSLTETAAAHAPQPGEAAPPLALLDGEGIRRSLADERGRWVILYFYPTDDTPGCTTEACDFRDALADVHAAGAIVWGVSAQGQASHRRFTAKYELNFPLLVDSDHTAGMTWGTWQEKSNYGRSYMGTARTTFLVDPGGRIAHTWEHVKAAGHVNDVLATLRDAQSKAAARA